MSYVSGSSGGLASLEAAKRAGDAAFFAQIMRNQEKREQASQEALKAQEKPVTISLGGNAMTLNTDEASQLYNLLSPSADLYSASPDQMFELPGGGQASGRELSTALATLILNDKT